MPPGSSIIPRSVPKKAKTCTTRHREFKIGKLPGIESENFRWSDGFYYQIDAKFTEEEESTIQVGIQSLKDVLCINFTELDDDETKGADYAFIKRGDKGSGCKSEVGRMGGKQTINLEPESEDDLGCITVDTVVHEIIHALGFYHEHSRPDRDEHIKIFWEYIEPNTKWQFQVASDWTQIYDVPYDLKSNMHYDSLAFSINKFNATIRTKVDNELGEIIQENTEMSPLDVLKLQRMYHPYCPHDKK